MTYAQVLEKRGRVKGLQQGMQQGMQQEKLVIARNMLSKLQLNIDAVQQATGLTQQELDKLVRERGRN